MSAMLGRFEQNVRVRVGCLGIARKYGVSAFHGSGNMPVEQTITLCGFASPIVHECNWLL
jgi:hypothetical protein